MDGYHQEEPSPEVVGARARITRPKNQSVAARDQAWKELPQPHDLTAFGLSNVKPRFSIPS